MFLIAIFALFIAACGGAAPTVADKPSESAETNGRPPETVAAHSLEKEKEARAMPTPEDGAQPVEKSDKKSKWTRSGDPIDVSEFNAAIAGAEKELKADPSDETLKKNLAEAYTKRGVALTNARQYAAAIGDYRKALKYDAGNEEAQKWVTMITNIYKSMNREVPPEGEEPEPLEFKKEKV